MRTRPGQKLKLTSVEELLKVPAEEMATEIEINQIHSFKDHPFKVLDDDRMTDLVESINIHSTFPRKYAFAENILIKIKRDIFIDLRTSEA